MKFLKEINGYILPHQTFNCPYIKGNQATHESIIIENIKPSDLDRLLEMGYRHFGPYFFRPICASCHQCIPIRVNAQNHLLTKNARRLMRKNSRIDIKLTLPVPRPELFRIFQKHKQRFDDTPQDTYQDYIDGFYYPFPFNHSLIMMYGHHVAAISHIDITDTAISAVYSYFDNRFSKCSPGTYLIYQILMLANKMKLEWVYLGYHVESNRHMNYKTRFRPNQILKTEGDWVDYTTVSGEILSPDSVTEGFHPMQSFPAK